MHAVFCFSAHHRCNKWLCRLPWTSCQLQPICLFSSKHRTVSGLYLHDFTWCTANDRLTEKLQDWASVNQRPGRPTLCYKIWINQLIVLSTGPFVFKAILKVILLYDMLLLLVNKPSPASINMKKVDRMQPGVRSEWETRSARRMQTCIWVYILLSLTTTTTSGLRVSLQQSHIFGNTTDQASGKSQENPESC